MDFLTLHITMSSLWRLLTHLGISLIAGLLLSLAYQISSREDEQPSQPFAWLFVIMPPLVSVIIFMVEDNFLRALYLLGATALIRFRNPVKNPLTTILVFATVGTGASAGFGFYAASISLAVVCVLVISGGYFTTRQKEKWVNRVLYLACPQSHSPDLVLHDMGRWLRRWTKLSIETSGSGDYLDWFYQVQLRKDQDVKELIEKFQMHGMKAVMLEPRNLEEF
jgi:hypothetical protein